MEDKLKRAMTFPQAAPPRVTEQMLRRRQQERWARLQLQILCLLSLLWTAGLCLLGWMFLPVLPGYSLVLGFVVFVALPMGGGLSALLVRRERKEHKL